MRADKVLYSFIKYAAKNKKVDKDGEFESLVSKTKEIARKFKVPLSVALGAALTLAGVKGYPALKARAQQLGTKNPLKIILSFFKKSPGAAGTGGATTTGT